MPVQPIIIGLDIGGTKFLAAAQDEMGNIIAQIREDTPLDLNAGLALLQDMTRRVAGGRPLAAIGAAVGGPLDYKTGVVSPLHQPQWRDVPLKAILEEAFGCPAALDVDTNVAALGEYAHLAAPVDRMLYLTLSTGMGGGMIAGGRIDRGANGAHPEVGHQCIPFRCAHPERAVCECGAGVCLESLVSGNGIRRVYGKPAEQLTPEEWVEVAYNLGMGLRNMAALYAPDIILIGGGVAVGGGEAFISQARQVMVDGLKIVPIPKVRLSNLGYETALRGALTLARKTAAGEEI